MDMLQLLEGVEALKKEILDLHGHGERGRGWVAEEAHGLDRAKFWKTENVQYYITTEN